MGETDLISRQAAIDAVEKLDIPEDMCVFEILSHVELAITLLPSAQPEIIHCESCEHWKNGHICECLSRYGTFETPKNFYCGYGKEK